jgi:polyisoprenoid-binding protein YceI
MDPDHTDVVATWSHLGFSNPMAHFGDVDGTIVYDAEDVGRSLVTATIPLTGLNAHVEKFDEHLRSDELFDLAKFPTITFKSNKVEATGSDKALRVTGDLTVRGITRPVTLEVTLNGMGEHPMAKRPAIGFDATTTLKRSDFGLGYAVPAVSDEVRIRITTEALAPNGAE